MTGLGWVAVVAAAAALLAATAVVVALAARPGGRIPSGRMARLLHVGRLTARLSASWFGAALRRRLAGSERRARLDEEQRRASARAVAETMGQMKGALMKLGQMMSFVSEQVPPEMRAALAALQTSAPPMDFALLRDVAERELGRPLERAFARFDERPLASASIGQVHRAQLPGGDEVVVKIQYPGVAEAIRGDLANVALISRMAGMLYPNADLKPVVEELRDRITEELDYGIEARNQRTFGARYAGHPFVRVPRVIDACSTARVLTSEYTPGRRFAEVRGDPPERRSHWGEILYRFLMGSIQQRMFNGDPHPGNYLFDDEGRVIFLDFGCVKFFPEPMWKAWRAMVVAHLERDPAKFRRRAVGLGFLAEDSALDETRLYDYFGVFYEPIKEDQPFTFTREYNERCVRTTLRPDGPLAGMEKLLNLPRDFALVNRINLGMYAILSDLGATGNFHRVHREYLWGAEPSTELGAKERAWRKLPP